LSPVRSNGDDIEVQTIRQGSYNVSKNLMIIGMTLIICGTSTYKYLPKIVLLQDFAGFTFYVNLLLILTIVGLIMVSQSLIPSFEHIFLNIFMLFRPGDRRMKPIVVKNLESHGKRNMKTSLMFTVTVSFLVFSAANL
jgi:hypothetical protein